MHTAVAHLSPTGIKGAHSVFGVYGAELGGSHPRETLVILSGVSLRALAWLHRYGQKAHGQKGRAISKMII